MEIVFLEQSKFKTTNTQLHRNKSLPRRENKKLGRCISLLCNNRNIIILRARAFVGENNNSNQSSTSHKRVNAQITGQCAHLPISTHNPKIFLCPFPLPTQGVFLLMSKAVFILCYFHSALLGTGPRQLGVGAVDCLRFVFEW